MRKGGRWVGVKVHGRNVLMTGCKGRNETSASGPAGGCLGAAWGLLPQATEIMIMMTIMVMTWGRREWGSWHE